ncbi:hypothetical protein [Coleofasciculus sp. H7-2]|uniref:hypothetical protein n=1 Tax=Coleofasciculus sp. H7-2 TaxID=3351545 RepID=UPI0036717997
MDYLFLLLLTRIAQTAAFLGVWGCDSEALTCQFARCADLSGKRFWGEDAIASLELLHS